MREKVEAKDKKEEGEVKVKVKVKVEVEIEIGSLSRGIEFIVFCFSSCSVQAVSWLHPAQAVSRPPI